MQPIPSDTEDQILLSELKKIPEYCIFLTDDRGYIKSWNESAQNLMGYCEAEIIGENVDIFTQNKSDFQQYTFDTTSFSEILERRDYRVKKDGTIFWAHEIIKGVHSYTTFTGFLFILHDITKYKSEEKKAEKWQQMFNRSGWGFAITLPETDTFEMVNPAFAKMHGFDDPDDLKGQTITKLLASPSLQDFKKVVDLIHKKGNYMFESWHKRKDGSSFPAIVDITAVKDESGRVLHRLIQIKDNSEVKEIQKQIRIQEEKFTQLFEQASEGIFIADLDGNLLEINTAAAQLLSTTKQELLGKNVFDLIPKKDHERLLKEKNEIIGSAKTIVTEWELYKSNRELLPVEASVKILPDGRWQAFVRDISERKRTQEILIESEQKFRGLLEELYDVIIIVNQQGLIEFVNKQFKAKFLYEPEDVLGKTIEVLIPERYRQQHVGQRMKYMAKLVARPMGLV